MFSISLTAWSRLDKEDMEGVSLMISLTVKSVVEDLSSLLTSAGCTVLIAGLGFRKLHGIAMAYVAGT